jgi:eukaryotic-like serine/threonine-protein kinase
VKATEFSVLGPLMGGFGSQAFLGCLHAEDGLIKPAVMVFLPDEIVEDVDLFRKVWAETDLGTQIDHVNVIGVMGLARLDEGYARVVEYADAESLRSVYRRATTLKKPVPPHIACALVADAAMGIHYAHELGLMETGEPMIHGGVRPETLQVSFKGMGKVTGYGATTIAEVMRKNRNDSGKDAYTAPEQSYGGRAAVTLQTDVYALGCVLYEALTGKAPFAADNDLAEAMIKDELSKPAHEGITDAMAMVVLRATKKKSAERYATALELRQEILDKCEVASELDIRRYMDELFPPDTVPRATRDQMLIAARERRPAPTGRLLIEIPPELARPTRVRGAQPSDAEIEAATGQAVEITPVHQQAPPPPSRLAPQTVPLLKNPLAEMTEDMALPPGGVDVSLGSELGDEPPPSAAPAAAVHREVQRESAAPARASPVAGRAGVPPPPSWQAQPTSPPQSAPQYASQPPVVYRNSPMVLVALGALGALAVAALVIVVMNNNKEPPPPPQIIVQAPPPPPEPPPPPPPADPTPEPSPDAATKASPPKSGGDSGAKTPKPVATGPGKINVTTDPKTMVITVNGQNIGTGSGTWEGKAGAVKIVARDAALKATSTKTVKLRPGETMNVELEAQKGTLTFDQLADGLEVFVDGKRIGKTPMPAIELYAGPHKIAVKKGANQVNLNATIVAYRELFITANFE